MAENVLALMSWKKAGNYFSKNDTALLPVGSTEQHGPQNPLGTDHMIAYRLAVEAGRKTGVLVLPPVPFGVSLHHSSFPGTIWIREAAFKEYLRDVMLSLHRHGTRKIIVVNGHGGNLRSLQSLAAELRDDPGILIVIYQWWTAIRSSERIREVFGPEEMGHAAAAETSLNLYLHPDAVEMEEAVDEEPARLPTDGLGFYPEYTHDRTSSGVFGKASSADGEKGRLLFEESLNALIRLTVIVRDMKWDRVPPVYGRR